MNLKKILCGIILVALTLPTYAFSGPNKTHRGGTGPMPWEYIQGYWTGIAGGDESIRIQILNTDRYGSRLISIQLIEPAGNSVIADGFVFATAQATSIHAVLRGVDGPWDIKATTIPSQNPCPANPPLMFAVKPPSPHSQMRGTYIMKRKFDLSFRPIENVASGCTRQQKSSVPTAVAEATSAKNFMQ